MRLAGLMSWWITGVGWSARYSSTRQMRMAWRTTSSAGSGRAATVRPRGSTWVTARSSVSPSMYSMTI